MQICGGESSGKTSLIKKLKLAFGKKISTLEQNNFYFPIKKETYYNPEDVTEEQKLRRINLNYNFDHPYAIDWNLFETAIETLKEYKDYQGPYFDQKTKNRVDKAYLVFKSPVVLIDGTMLLYKESIRKKLEVKLFVETDSDVRLSRRLIKHQNSSDFNLDDFIEVFFKFVKPCHEEFVEPYKSYADIIIPNYGFSLEEAVLGGKLYINYI